MDGLRREVRGTTRRRGLPGFVFRLDCAISLRRNDTIGMMNQNISEARSLVENDAAAEEFFGAVAAESAVALDTEFMRVRTYYAELCLLQVARINGRTACIDPLQVSRSILRECLRRIDGEFVVHSAGQDLEVLRSALDMTPNRLFDTQIAAAFLGMGEQVSYSSLVNRLLGVELAKGQTRTDWCNRPLTGAQIEYAFDDVAHLLELRDMLADRLDRTGKLKWVENACVELVDKADAMGDDSVVARFKAGAGVRPERQPLLRELVLWREQKARSMNRPREWIVPGSDLVQIAINAPDSTKRLESCTSGSGQLKKYACELVQLVAQPREENSAAVIWHRHDDLDPDKKTLLKNIQRRVREFCEEMSISPAAVASRSDLEALVSGRPGRLDSGWRRELLEDLLEELL